jgi:hypothetical protein
MNHAVIMTYATVSKAVLAPSRIGDPRSNVKNKYLLAPAQLHSRPKFRDNVEAAPLTIEMSSCGVDIQLELSVGHEFHQCSGNLDGQYNLPYYFAMSSRQHYKPTPRQWNALT